MSRGTALPAPEPLPRRLRRAAPRQQNKPKPKQTIAFRLKAISNREQTCFYAEQLLPLFRCCLFPLLLHLVSQTMSLQANLTANVKKYID